MKNRNNESVSKFLSVSKVTSNVEDKIRPSTLFNSPSKPGNFSSYTTSTDSIAIASISDWHETVENLKSILMECGSCAHNMI
jgi:hypothetical protein